ncbi:RES domain-containing protein [Chromobacterium violaceum]|uniref:RES domain-containing protein n=1 Tax=Chromobacterium violaceum TaxID=536 RepID=UPI0005B9F456|nr:RES domain-containing protein [Chromobacterium violaceum]
MALQSTKLQMSAPTSLSKVRETITELNKIDLARADYSYLLKQIGMLMSGIPVQASFPLKGTVFYRGIAYETKPMDTSFLGAPPVQLVTGYQRCNPPGKPMFYASVDPNAIFAELDVQVGSKIYLSTWEVVDDFLYFRIPPRASEEFQSSPAYAKIETFFETRFAQPIHETFSEQYKLTAAIAEQLSGQSVMSIMPMQQLPKLAAVAYPSVAHKSRADNIAIRPEVAASCLKLKNVTELFIIDRDETSWTVEGRDFSTTFENEVIAWSERPPQWAGPIGEAVNIEIGSNGWVARKSDGTIIPTL